MVFKIFKRGKYRSISIVDYDAKLKPNPLRTTLFSVKNERMVLGPESLLLCSVLGIFVNKIRLLFRIIIGG